MARPTKVKKRPALVTVAEAARRLGITRQAVALAVLEGRLRGVAATVPRLMIPVAALLAYRPSRAHVASGRTPKDA